MIDSYIYIIIALLPLASLMLVFQKNPYQALVVRAILGAVAALVYAVLGGADVALTEALVGTMLAVTLYVIAVRSSLVMRLGIIAGMETEEDCMAELLTRLSKTIKQHYLRLEIVEYPNLPALKSALLAKEVHAICSRQVERSHEKNSTKPIYDTAIRVRRLFEIVQTEASVPETTLTYVTVQNTEEKH